MMRNFFIGYLLIMVSGCLTNPTNAVWPNGKLSDTDIKLTDADGDGYFAENDDCDDQNADINPEAREICDKNQTDEDCDGVSDDNDPSTDFSTGTVFFLDVDEDGFGVQSSETYRCEISVGFAPNPNDCDDNNPLVNPNQKEICTTPFDDDCDGDLNNGDDTPTWYEDVDGDGFGNTDVSVVSCSQPSGYVFDDTDCDDDNIAINPAMDEKCDIDGVDDNCNGVANDDDMDLIDGIVWYADTDSDTYGDPQNSVVRCFLPSGYVANSDDCLDMDVTINPDAMEVCGNTVDEDCSGSYDDRDFDTDGAVDKNCTIDGVTIGDDCDDENQYANPMQIETCITPYDDDCDGDLSNGDDAFTWYADIDGDLFGDVNNSVKRCFQPAGFIVNADDCNDMDIAINPNAQEICDANGVDEDCDGFVNDTDPNVQNTITWYADLDTDAFGDANNVLLACEVPSGYVANSDDCLDTDTTINPNAMEVCGNTVDEDCSSSYDDRDFDADGSVDQNCMIDGITVGGDCNDNNNMISPLQTETCNGIDDDCDGVIDNGVKTTFYFDGDADGYGDPAMTESACTPSIDFVANSDDCNDTLFKISPNAPEACDDGVDNDCDGVVDYPDLNGDGVPDDPKCTIELMCSDLGWGTTSWIINDDLLAQTEEPLIDAVNLRFWAWDIYPNTWHAEYLYAGTGWYDNIPYSDWSVDLKASDGTTSFVDFTNAYIADETYCAIRYDTVVDRLVVKVTPP